jgi:hypothetical protein
MDMPTLRYPSSGSGTVRQHVPLDHGDGPKEISQDSCGKQPAHARPKNDRALTQLWHDETPASRSDLGHLAEPPPKGINRPTAISQNWLIKVLFACPCGDGVGLFNVVGAALGHVAAEIKNRGSTDLCIVVGRTTAGITGV